MRRGTSVLWVVGSLALALAGCGRDEQTPQGSQAERGDQAQGPATTEVTRPAGEPTTTQVASGEVTVGGFSIESPGGAETTVPQVSVEREAARDYLEQVQPIVRDTTGDVSDLVQPEVRAENGRLEIDLGVSSLRNAREDVDSGLERLRKVRAPEGLGPVHTRLASAHEEVLPAYDNVIEAAESGDPDRLSEAVRESLPRIERFNAEARSIVQDLEQAAGPR